MLALLAKHGLFDLTVQARGDTEIDDHHTVEDVGIVLGDALKQALGKKEGVRRFGWASVPLDETLAQVTVDLSGRPYLVYHVDLPQRRIKTFDLGLFEDFFQAFSTHAALNLHINVLYDRVPIHESQHEDGAVPPILNHRGDQSLFVESELFEIHARLPQRPDDRTGMPRSRR